jgi:arabinosaccharide transport system permease protein
MTYMSSGTLVKQPFAKRILHRTILAPKVAPYILVLPFLITFALFFLYPFISALEMSTLRFTGFVDFEYVGLENFRALNNPRFFTTIRVNLTYTFWTILILVPLPLLLAVLVNSKLTIGSTFFKSTYFIPQLTSVIVAGMFFRFAFSGTETALVNTLVGFFGIEPVSWLWQAVPAMATLVLLCVWRWFGINLIYFLSSLQAIPPEQYEAASIDGAGAIGRFIHVTLPSIKPTIIFVTVISVFGGMAMFAESYALYGAPRTPGDHASTMVGYIYAQAFFEGKGGLAAAAGMALLSIVMVINVIVLAITGSFKKGD